MISTMDLYHIHEFDFDFEKEKEKGKGYWFKLLSHFTLKAH
jgi:hypothetical protein